MKAFDTLLITLSCLMKIRIVSIVEPVLINRVRWEEVLPSKLVRKWCHSNSTKGISEHNYLLETLYYTNQTNNNFESTIENYLFSIRLDPNTKVFKDISVKVEKAKNANWEYSNGDKLIEGGIFDKSNKKG